MTSHSAKGVPSATWKKRLQCLVGGILAFLIGWWQLHHGMFAWRSYNGQPVFAYSGIAAGIVLILAALAPARIIAEMASVRKYQPYRPGHSHADARIDQSG